MGTIYKKKVTRALPQGAELYTRGGKQFARWKDAKGKPRTATINASGRIVVEGGCWIAKFRDGAGLVQEISTGCRDKQAAQAVLAEHERRAERVKARILTAAEDRVVDHLGLPLKVHRDAYVSGLRIEGRSDCHVENIERMLKLVADACKFSTLADLNRGTLESWLTQQSKKSARTRNAYRGACVAFANWCIGTGRLLSNPFTKIAKANEALDVRRQRRALTEAELKRLLDVARQRPLNEAQTVRRGADKGRLIAKLRTEVVERLEWLGRERALIYKTLALTGLRKGELASLTIGQVHLDGKLPCLELAAKDAKNRTAAQIPLRRDLADDLETWIADLRKRASGDPGQSEGAICLQMTPADELPGNTPLFYVPTGLLRILNRDLKAAGIPKRDERGRQIDVHAMRMTFGTLLSKSGAAPRTAQAALRHSTIDLTMNVYTDPKLLDIHGALEALPSLPLEGNAHRQARELTGTYGRCAVAPNVAPDAVPDEQKQASAGNLAVGRSRDGDDERFAVTSSWDTKKDSPTITVNESHQSGRQNTS